MSHSCSNCGKECKDKRGLSVHYKSCIQPKSSTCEYCNYLFSSTRSLQTHYTTCKVLRQQKEEEERKKLFEEQKKNTKLEMEMQYNLLKADFDKQTSHFETFKESMILQVKMHEEAYQKLEKEKTISIDNLKDAHQHELKIREEAYQKLEKSKNTLISNIQESHAVQLKMRDEAEAVTEKEKQGLLDRIKALENDIKEQKDDIRRLSKNYDKTVNTVTTLSIRDKETSGKTIIQNIHNNNSQTIQLQHFDPSFLSGKIDPPQCMISNVDAMFNYLKSGGLCNYYRVTDRTRKSLLWYDKEGKEIRDSNGTQLTNLILTALEPDFRKEIMWYQGQINELQQKPEQHLYSDLISTYYNNISFCRSLLSPFDVKMVNKITRGISDMAKTVQDTTVDHVIDAKPTFVSFLTTLQSILYPEANEWMNLSNEELGIFLATRLGDSITIEPASKTTGRVYIQDDNKRVTPINKDQLSELVSEAMGNIKEDMLLEVLLKMNKKATNYNKDTEIEKWFNDPSPEQASEMFSGLCRRR